MQLQDKRAAVRFACEAPVIIENCRSGQHYDGSIYNYSQMGMYIELDSFLSPGADIHIVPEKDILPMQKKFCRAQIVWCREITGAVVMYNYGAGVCWGPTPTGKPAGCRNLFKVIEGGAGDNNL